MTQKLIVVRNERVCSSVLEDRAQELSVNGPESQRSSRIVRKKTLHKVQRRTEITEIPSSSIGRSNS